MLETKQHKKETINMNQIAKKENAGALAVNLFEADAHAGTQNMSREDLALPFFESIRTTISRS
jgi:hypothetical protein